MFTISFSYTKCIHSAKWQVQLQLTISWRRTYSETYLQRVSTGLAEIWRKTLIGLVFVSCTLYTTCWFWNNLFMFQKHKTQDKKYSFFDMMFVHISVLFLFCYLSSKLTLFSKLLIQKYLINDSFIALNLTWHL